MQQSSLAALKATVGDGPLLQLAGHERPVQSASNSCEQVPPGPHVMA